MATITADKASTQSLVQALAAALLARGWWLTTAESCTGGGVAEALTSVAGSSAWFDRGFVSYSNASKQDMLDVPAAIIEKHGAVSEPVAIAMARGALAHSRAQLALAVTGIAGPGGGSAAKPVGTVWFAWASETHTESVAQHFAGDRAAVRSQSVNVALQGLIRMAERGGQA